MNRTLLASFASLSLLLAACGSTIAMTPDPIVPHATGAIEVEASEGKNEYTVRVEHLGDPAKLDASATTYVVWIKPAKDDAVFTNVGILKVDDDASGKMTFPSPFTEFEMQVTTESAPDVTAPAGKVVLRSNVDI